MINYIRSVCRGRALVALYLLAMSLVGGCNEPTTISVFDPWIDNPRTVQGWVEGLATGSTVELKFTINSVPKHTFVTGNGGFHLNEDLELMLHNDDTYSITVSTQPAIERCRVINGEGTMENGDGSVTDIKVVCGERPSGFTLEGSVGGKINIQHFSFHAPSSVFTLECQTPSGWVTFDTQTLGTTNLNHDQNGDAFYGFESVDIIGKMPSDCRYDNSWSSGKLWTHTCMYQETFSSSISWKYRILDSNGVLQNTWRTSEGTCFDEYLQDNANFANGNGVLDAVYQCDTGSYDFRELSYGSSESVIGAPPYGSVSPYDGKVCICGSAVHCGEPFTLSINSTQIFDIINAASGFYDTYYGRLDTPF